MKRNFDRTFAEFSTQRLLANGKLETVEIDLAADLRIGKDLQAALVKSMATYVWYAQLKEHAHAQMKQAKYRCHNLEEALYDKIKLANPKLTETWVKNKIHLDVKWRKIIKRYMTWRDRYRFLSEICIALKERNENLRTLESSERAERRGAYGA